MDGNIDALPRQLGHEGLNPQPTASIAFRVSCKDVGASQLFRNLLLQ